VLLLQLIVRLMSQWKILLADELVMPVLSPSGQLQHVTDRQVESTASGSDLVAGLQGRRWDFRQPYRAHSSET